MTPTSNPLLRRALRWTLLLGVLLFLVIGGIGAAVTGAAGIATAAVGLAIAMGFMAVTAGSIVLANRFAGNELFVGAFFGIVMGGWLLKFVLFIVAMFALRSASWVSPGVLFASLIAGILGSLAVDLVVIVRSKMPYVSDVQLPSVGDDQRD